MSVKYLSIQNLQIAVLFLFRANAHSAVTCAGEHKLDELVLRSCTSVCPYAIDAPVITRFSLYLFRDVLLT